MCQNITLGANLDRRIEDLRPRLDLGRGCQREAALPDVHSGRTPETYWNCVVVVQSSPRWAGKEEEHLGSSPRMFMTAKVVCREQAASNGGSAVDTLMARRF